MTENWTPPSNQTLFIDDNGRKKQRKYISTKIYVTNNNCGPGKNHLACHFKKIKTEKTGGN